MAISLILLRYIMPRLVYKLMVVVYTAKMSAPVTPRLVVERVEQRKRIVASTHDGSHLGRSQSNQRHGSQQVLLARAIQLYIG